MASPINHLLQVGTAILARIKALAVLGDTGIVNDGETEAAFAGGQDSAIKRCKCTGKGANGILNLVLSVHFFGVS